MFSSLGAPEILVIALIFILLFGAKRLPDAARSIGRSMRIFKSEVKEMANDDTNNYQQPVQQQQQLPQAQPVQPMQQQMQQPLQQQPVQQPVQQPAPQQNPNVQ